MSTLATASTDAETLPGRRGAAKKRPKRSAGITPYLLIMPSMLVIIGIFAVPFVEMLLLSFQNWSQVNPFSTALTGSWDGLHNYTTQLTNAQFWQTTLRTFIVTVIMVVLSMGIGLLFALLMQRISTWARYLLTFALMLVWSIPTLVSTLVFQWMFNKQFGVVNYVLGLNSYDWSLDSVTGWSVIILMVVWGAVPMISIMLYAGLTQVPKELVEAARVDGASPWQTFRSVVEPMIRPVVLIMTALSVFWDVQVFTQIYAYFNGQPEQRYYTLGIWSYVEGGQDFNYGISTTLTTISMIFMLVITVPYLRQLIRIGDAK